MKINKTQLKDFFEKEEKKTYLKYGQFIHRPAIENETVLTIVSGKLETLRVAKKDEVVVRNITVGSSAESYIIPIEVFKKRYTVYSNTKIIDGITWYFAEAKGSIEAFQFKVYLNKIPNHTERYNQIIFDAPWNEEMICNEGDYIARPIPGSDTDIYRIEKDTFDLTYKLKTE